MTFQAQTLGNSASDDPATDDDDPRHIKKIATLPLSPLRGERFRERCLEEEDLTYEHSFDMV
jgi:hypothetical protein